MSVCLYLTRIIFPFFSTIDHDRMFFYVKCDRDVKVEVNFHFLYHIY